MAIPMSRVGELVYAAMTRIRELGGEAVVRHVFDDIEPALNLNEEEQGLLSNGERRWTNLIRWYSIDATKSGYLTKENGLWRLTEAGTKALEKPQKEFFDDIRSGYREWDKGRKMEMGATESMPIEAAVPGEEEVTSTATFQDASERAAQEIARHIEGLGPYEFQELVGEVFESMGYHVRSVAPPGPDGGIDLVVFPDPLGTKDPRMIVQVKHRGEKASVQEVRELAGILRAVGDMGVFVSRSGFTSEARREAEMGAKRIELLNLDRILKHAIDHYGSLSERGRTLLPLTPVHFLTPRS